ncbi:hypothetical protein [Microbulbifer taiwanensis]|uniref:Uncharacterized protein n=2 Tax=Microbulbifer taiwanensis TaxID=986746 RepID=A0ABW1YTZ0_9GAMM|nr:hypothetical protein [Microbulbifer taiwanensis]
MYFIKLVNRWFEYSWVLLLVAAIVGSIAVISATGADGSLINTAVDVLRNAKSKGAGLVAIAIVLAPIFNLYVWQKITIYIREAHLDVVKFQGLKVRKPIQSKSSLAICIASGIPLFSVFLWLFTYHLEFFWGSDRIFWFSPGMWVGFVVAIAIPLFGSKLFPIPAKKVRGYVDSLE